MKKFFLIVLAFALVFWLLALRQKKISQYFIQTQNLISLNYPKSFEVSSGSYSYDLIDVTFINLLLDEDSKITISYEYQNGGDDTPYEAGDTGGGLWPPQPEELVFDLNEEDLTLLGQYLGKELYVSRVNKEEGRFAVYQKIGNKFTSNLAILNDDQDRPNYNASLFIGGTTDVDSNKQQKNYKEFIKILKSMKITTIKKPE